MVEGLTLYKLIVLYLLKLVDLPLTNTQLTEFLIDGGYADYFRSQQAVSELVEAGLISVEKIRNISRYHLAEDGAHTLECFLRDIPYAIRIEAQEYLKQHSIDIKNENSVLADWTITEDGTCMVTCRVQEGKETLLSVSMNVVSTEAAEELCRRWPDASGEIYAFLIEKLLTPQGSAQSF